MPWARHAAGHTRAFDDQAAWLVTHTSKTAVVELMRVAWRTVGAIAARVVTDARAAHDPFDGLVRSWCRCGSARVQAAGAGTAIDVVAAMTTVKGDVVGGRWTLARSGCSSLLTHRA